MKKAIIVHGWDGHPKEGWFPWLKNQLEKKGFTVNIPQLPQPEKPRIDKWIPFLIKSFPNPDKNTYFVSHSMGCQAIARYLEKLPKNIKVGGVIFVAGFFKKLTGLEDDPDVQETGKHWLDANINFEKIKSHLKKSIAIFSDDDPYVPLDNQYDFKNKLRSKIIIEHKKGHFSADLDNATKVPIVLESILEISA